MNIELLLYNISGFVVLLMVPLLYHAIIYGVNSDFKLIVNSLFASNYIFIIWMLILSTVGFFYSALLVALSLITFIVIRLNIKKVPSTKQSIYQTSHNIRSIHILILILFVAFSMIQSQLRPDAFSSDSYAKYLGRGHHIALEHHHPVVNSDNLEYSHNSSSPVAYLYTGFIFSSLFTHEQLARGMPIYFMTLTLLLVMAWGDIITGLNTGLLAVAITLSSFYFLRSSIAVMQEPALLFFTTLTFYYLFNCIKRPTFKSIFMIFGALSLALLSKESILIVAVIVFIGIIFSVKKTIGVHKIFLYSIIGSLPILFWFSKNYYYWGNPVFPHLEIIFKSHFYDLVKLSQDIVKPSVDSAQVPLGRFLFLFIATFPFILFAIRYCIKYWHEDQIKIISIAFVLTLLYLLVYNGRWLVRYLVHFIGIYSIVSAVSLSEYKNKARYLYNPTSITIISIMFMMAWLYHVSSLVPYKQAKGSRFEVMDFLNQHTSGSKVVKIMGNEDLPAVNWYMRDKKIYHSYRFHDIDFLKINGGALRVADVSSIYEQLSKINVKYVYAANRPITNDLFYSKISNGSKYFNLVFDSGGAKIWELVPLNVN